MTNKCPVCDSELVKTHEDTLEGHLCELVEDCLNCKMYMYEFFYGSYRETIGTTAYSVYDDKEDLEERKARLSRRQNLINIVKEQVNREQVNNMLKNILILDLETSGLDVTKDKIFEIACIAIDKQENIHRFQKVVTHKILPPMVPFVLDMHMKNGLFAEMIKLGFANDWHIVFNSFNSWLYSVFKCMADGNSKERFILAGKNIAKLDLPLLLNQANIVNEDFSRILTKHIGHRYLDVGSMMFDDSDCEKGALKDLEGCVLKACNYHTEELFGTSHRALADCEKVLRCIGPNSYKKYVEMFT